MLSAIQALLSYDYVEGVIDEDSFIAEAMHIKGGICLPRNVTAQQIVDIVIKYLKANPQTRHYTAGGEVWVAFYEIFPCPKE